MQEEVDEKTVALAVSTTKMTAQALKNSLEKFLQRVDERNRIHVNEARERYRRRAPTVPERRA